MAKDRIVIPGIPTDAARVIIERLREQDERLAILERRGGRAGIVTTDTAAKVGELLNIEAPTAGLTVVLPQSTQALRNARVTLSFRNSNPVRIVCVLGTVNGETFVTNDRPGTYDAICDGLGGWAVQVGVSETGSGAGGSPDAEYVVGAADASLANARVATDSAEVDAVLTTPNVITWALNVASVAFSKLANLAGLSVLGRAANSSGVMAAITATAGYQALRSNATGTAIGWENYLPTSHIPASITGLQNPYLLPAGFAHGDTLRLTITGDTTIRALLDSAGTRDTLPEGFEFNLCLSDQSGGSAPGWFLDIEDNVAVTGNEGFFRTPGQVQGTSPGPSYRMRSEEEGCRVAMQFGNWRIISGTAGQLINGAITVAAGNGSTRASQFSGIRDNGALETARGFLNFRDSNSLSAFVVQDAANDEMEVTFGRNALTGDVTAAFDSGVTAIAAGVIVDADVNASAAIAMTKTGALTGFAAKASGASATTSAEPIVTYSASANMSAERVLTASTSVTLNTGTAGQIAPERAALTGDVTATANSNATTIANDAVTNAKAANMAANTYKANPTTGSADPQDVAVATNEVVCRAGGNLGVVALTSNGVLGRSSGDITDINVASGEVLANLDEGNTSTDLGGQSKVAFHRWLNSVSRSHAWVDDFQGNLAAVTASYTNVAGYTITLSATTDPEFFGAINLSAGTGTTRGRFALGADESAINFNWGSLRYVCVIMRVGSNGVDADTAFSCGIVGPFNTYGAVNVSQLAGTSEGVFWEYVAALNSGQWRAGIRTSSATSATASGVTAAASTRYKLEIIRTASGTAYWYLNDSLVRTDAASWPPDAGCTFFWTIIGSTAGARSTQLDHLTIVSVAPAERFS